MKKIKLITSLSAVTALGWGVALTATSCSNNSTVNLTATIPEDAWSLPPQVGVTSIMTLEDLNKIVITPEVNFNKTPINQSTIEYDVERAVNEFGFHWGPSFLWFSITPTKSGNLPINISFSCYKEGSSTENGTKYNLTSSINVLEAAPTFSATFKENSSAEAKEIKELTQLDNFLESGNEIEFTLNNLPEGKSLGGIKLTYNTLLDPQDMIGGEEGSEITAPVNNKAKWTVGNTSLEKITAYSCITVQGYEDAACSEGKEISLPFIFFNNGKEYEFSKPTPSSGTFTQDEEIGSWADVTNPSQGVQTLTFNTPEGADTNTAQFVGYKVDAEGKWTDLNSEGDITFTTTKDLVSGSGTTKGVLTLSKNVTTAPVETFVVGYYDKNGLTYTAFKISFKA